MSEITANTKEDEGLGQESPESLDHLVKKNYKEYFVPMLIQFLIGGVMNSADRFMAGIFVGSKALVAVNLVAPAFFLIFALGSLFSSGLGSYIGIMLGRKEHKLVAEMVSFSTMISLVVGFILSYLFYLYRVEIAYGVGATLEMIDSVIDYSVYLSPVFLLILVNGIIEAVLMNDGFPKFVSFTKSLMTITNVVMNVILVVQFHLGVKGLAIATTTGVALSLLLNFLYMIIKGKEVKFGAIRSHFREWLNIVYNGFSQFLTMGGIAFSMFVLNYTVSKYLGLNTMKAYSVAVIFMIFIRYPYMAASMGLQPIISRAFSEEKYDLLRKQISFNLKHSILTAVLFYFLMMPIVYFAAPHFFQPEEQVLVIPILYRIYLQLGLAFVFMVYVIQMPSYYTAIARPKESLFITVLRSSISIPIALLIFVPLFGEIGITLGYFIPDLFLSIGIFLYMKKHDFSTLKSVI